MNISANNLKRSGEIIYLDNEIRNNLKGIEEMIIEANQDNKTYIKYNVEQNFQVDGISNKTAQLYVYSKIIDELKKKEFGNRMLIDNGKVYIRIEWGNPIGDDELVNMKQTLADAMKKGSN
jgi:uncharacterized protein YdhG (YjbR/CyaY superfamily)